MKFVHPRCGAAVESVRCTNKAKRKLALLMIGLRFILFIAARFEVP